MLKTKNLSGFILVLILTFICLVISFGQAEAAVKTFSDIDGHWAKKNILEMNAYGIVQGYPDKTFKPNEEIQFQQVVAMIINAQGLKEEAEKADLTGLTFSEGTWAKGYLALAAQKNMLTKEGLSTLNPKRPATRLEVASLLCLAIGFAPDYGPLYFLDIEKINKNYLGYVGAIIKREIMVGMPGNIFAPAEKITRAQMCVILSRLLEKDWINPPSPMVRLTGRITGLDAWESAMEVKNLSGLNPVFMPQECPLFNGNDLVDFDFLQENLRIKLIVDSAGRACFGELLSDYGPVKGIEEGFLISFFTIDPVYNLFLESETGKREFDVYSDAMLVKGSTELTISDLEADAFLEASLDENNKIFKIKIHEPEKISGFLCQIDNSQLAIKTKGLRQIYEIGNNAQVTSSMIRPMSLLDLKPDDYVNLTIINDKVFQINYFPDVVAGLSGIVSRISSKYIYIVVNNQEERFGLDPQVEISERGSAVKLNELKRGDYVTFALAGGLNVISIEIINENEGEYTGAS